MMLLVKRQSNERPSIPLFDRFVLLALNCSIRHTTCFVCAKGMSDPVLKGASILILEDELLLRKHLVAVLEQQDADVTAIGTVDEARRVVGSLSFDFALLDLHLPDGLGTDLLKEGIFSPNTAVIVCTAEGGIKSAVEAIKNGAQDYLLKPIDSSVLPMILQKAKTSTRSARLVEHERRNPNKTGEQIYFGDALSDFKNKLEKITAVDERLGSQLPPVLIHGETGTGKTSIARWLHHNGPRRDSQLVEVNCPALPENLAESELFGHERGAFTDAKSARMGLFEAANGGTLFLDELPSLSLGIQAKILKTIEDRSIRRLGGNREIEVDVRIIAASNQDLGQAVKKGKFRDFFYDVLLDNQTIFDKTTVISLLKGQDRGRNNGERLFALMMFELWKREYKISM